MKQDTRVARVYKALVSAGDATDKGHVVILSKFGLFVAHDLTGQISQTAHRAHACSAPGFWRYKKNGFSFPRFSFGFVEDSSSQRRQEQSSAWWQYQRHHERQHHQHQCKDQHCKYQRQDHHRHQREGASFPQMLRTDFGGKGFIWLWDAVLMVSSERGPADAEEIAIGDTRSLPMVSSWRRVGNPDFCWEGRYNRV